MRRHSLPKPDDAIPVAKVSEIPEGGHKLVAVGGQDILVAKVNGTIRAFNDRCPHTSAPMHMGEIKNKHIRCPLHNAVFDMTTGAKCSEPIMGGLSGDVLATMPPERLAAMKRHAEILHGIKTYDLTMYPVEIDGDVVRVRV